MTPQALASVIRDRAQGHRGRLLVAIAGPPASGKTTLSADLARVLGDDSIVVPMDGFHFDNAVLAARGDLARKGAPHTFDTGGFAHALTRIRSGEEVAIPIFDRSLELARAGAALVEARHRIILVEGNYLLLDRSPWTEMREVYDFKVLVTAPEEVLTDRLVARWQAYGRTDGAAWIRSNDLPNVRLVLSASTGADLVIASA